MGTFNTKVTLDASPSLISHISDKICEYFSNDDYEVNRENLLNGGMDISISKGGVFKAILGMKTALKITLIPQDNYHISFEAGVGIFGQQVVPTVIMLFFAWPVLLTQIWGIIQQSQLDDKALEITKDVIKEKRTTVPSPYPSVSGESFKFCTNCGSRIHNSARFCSNCGKPLN